jgi:hypothetical protein
MRAITALSLVLLMTLTACGNGPGTSVGNFAGNWQMTLQRDQTNTASTLKTESGFLVQSGGALTGNLLLTGDTYCAGVGSAQGQVSGSNVAISLNQIGQTINLTGSLGSTGSISGTYSILASPCGSTQVGTWTATQVQALTGNLQGTFTSTQTSGVVYQVSGNVTQAANTGGSAANLSGSMTSTNAPCFSSVSISGSISGTSAVFNLLSSEGVSIGQFSGTTTSDASTITGLYNFLNTQPPPLNGCEDFGTAVVTVKQ